MYWIGDSKHWSVHRAKLMTMNMFYFIAGSLPCIILIPGLFFIPESPRWLVWIICNVLYYMNFFIFQSWLFECSFDQKKCKRVNNMIIYTFPFFLFLFFGFGGNWKILGQDGNDRRVWDFITSFKRIWYRHSCWSTWNQGI